VTPFVALLRAVNLPSHHPLAMADLRELATELGLREVRTVVQSGNLVFRHAGRATTAGLERRLEAAARERFGLVTDFFVRTGAEWGELVAGNPFPREAEEDPGHLLVLVLADAPSARAVAALQAAISGREVVRAAGRHLYAVYPDGVGRSKLTTALVERKLGTRVTGRNWTTVRKLAELAGAG
jgi:uncharacterized protein (DUF1697 family)